MNLHKLSRISHQPRHWLQKTAATTQNSRQIINKLSLNYLVFLPLWRKHFSGVNLTASLGILVGGRLFLWQPWWYCGRIPSSSTRYGWTRDTRITSFLLTRTSIHRATGVSSCNWNMWWNIKYVKKVIGCLPLSWESSNEKVQHSGCRVRAKDTAEKGCWRFKSKGQTSTKRTVK